MKGLNLPGSNPTANRAGIPIEQFVTAHGRPPDRDIFERLYAVRLDGIKASASGLPNSRLRVVYDNGTENEYLLRSLQRVLNEDVIEKIRAGTIDRFRYDLDTASLTRL